MRGTCAASSTRSGRAPGASADDTQSRTQLNFGVLLCLPTAPELPIGGSGDFGTSPFYGQLSDKPQLAFVDSSGEADVKRNSGREINGEYLLAVRRHGP